MTIEPSDFFIQSLLVMLVHRLDDYPFRPLRCLVYPDLSFGNLNLFHMSVLTLFTGYSIISFSINGTYHVFTSSAVGVCAPGKWNERL